MKPFRIVLSLAAGLFLVLPSCSPPKMSVKEARQVAVSMEDGPFIPPPRRVSDILDTLDRSGAMESEFTRELKSRADRVPSDTEDRAALALFYARRGIAAREIGRSAQALKDLETALTLARDEYGHNTPGLDFRQVAWILTNLGSVESIYGNFDRAISLQKQALKVSPISRSAQAYLLLTICHGVTGDFEAMERAADRGIHLCNKRIRQGNQKPWLEMYVSDMRAERLETRGHFDRAEPFRRAAAGKARQMGRKGYPRASLLRRVFLAENLEGQGRFVEGEIELREALEDIIGACGGESATVGMGVFYLGKNLLGQGRLDEAEQVLRAAKGILERSGLSDDSVYVALAKTLLAEILFCRDDLASARVLLDQVEKGMVRNRSFYETRVLRMPPVLITFLETGRTREAAGWISGFCERFARSLGAGHELTAVMQGLRGMVLAKQGETGKAMQDLSAAVPLLLREGFQRDFLKVHTNRHIVGTYIDLLRRYHVRETEEPARQAVSERIFKVLQGLEQSEVQQALGASGARAAAYSPDLADLVRKEQDLSLQIRALQVTLAGRVAASLKGRDPGRLRALRATIDNLVQARGLLRLEIGERFPRYGAFSRIRVLGFEDVRSALREGEALIVLHPWNERTYAWAIPRRAPPCFLAAGIGRDALGQRVGALRKTLAPSPETFGDIPAFDLQGARNLYARLLEPIEEGFRPARHLLVVAKDPLGPLPLSVLPTAPPRENRSESLLFSRYREVPWLIRRASITRLPSVASLNRPDGARGVRRERKPFAGFGDPVFSPGQVVRGSEAGSEPGEARKSPLHQKIAIRGIRTTAMGSMDDDRIGSLRLEHLNRLPDTADEIRRMAASVQADPSRDVFLGKEASERRVKTMDLSDRRVVAFATHALVPGDLDGLRQPAIALSSPAVTGGEEDGLLTMEEVLKLKLDADWVVLSACNTGAAKGAGAEALSGLGRAFFYAGTRSLLVSMWPVETTSARELTTGIFRVQEEEGLSRAEALQRSVLALMDGPGLKDPRTGKIVASYAHPFFWAPFIVVGDGGERPNRAN